MAQKIIQNGQTVMTAPGEGNPTCAIIFNNLTGVNIQDKREQQAYLAIMFRNFPLTYGEIELWEDGKLIDKGNIKK